MNKTVSVKETIKNVILIFAHYIMTILCCVMPKYHKILIYGMIDFTDNSEALYQYLINKKFNNSYEIICWSKVVPANAGENLINVVFTNKFLVVAYHHMTARYIFYSRELQFTNTPTRRQTVVNMWHGVPLKRFGYMVSEKQWFNLSRMFTYVCVNSDNLVGVMKASFRCQDEQIVVNGNPRCDYLFQKSNYIQAMESLRGNWKKTIIWLPTYRKSIDGTEDSAQCAQFQDTDSLHKLNDYLLCKDVLLIIKPHPLQRADEVTVSEMSNIKFIDNGLLCSNHIPLYSLLGETDALITDYSSVFADYLLINKPIAFMVDDMDSYAGKRGFSFDDPLNYMPGIKIRNQAEILGFIDSVLVGKDEWCEEHNKSLYKYK